MSRIWIVYRTRSDAVEAGEYHRVAVRAETRDEAIAEVCGTPTSTRMRGFAPDGSNAYAVPIPMGRKPRVLAGERLTVEQAELWEARRARITDDAGEDGS